MPRVIDHKKKPFSKAAKILFITMFSLEEVKKGDGCAPNRKTQLSQEKLQALNSMKKNQFI
jgi:hypothetical protein